MKSKEPDWLDEADRLRLQLGPALSGADITKVAEFLAATYRAGQEAGKAKPYEMHEIRGLPTGRTWLMG